MGEQRDINTLTLNVLSDTTEAEKSINNLSKSLMGLKTSLTSVGDSSGKIGALTNRLRNLSRIQLPDFSKTIQQLQEMSRIDLKNLDGRKLKLDLTVTGASEAERMKYAIHDAVKAVEQDAQDIGKDLKKAFNLDPNTTRQIAEQFKALGADIAKENGKNSGEIMSGILDALSKSGTVTKATFTEYFGGIGDSLSKEYSDFLKYIHEHKIKSSDILADVGGKGVKETWFKEGFGGYLDKKGLSLDSGYFNDLLQMFPNVLSGAREATAGVENFATDIDGASKRVSLSVDEMARIIREKMLEARNYLDGSISQSEFFQFLSEKVGTEAFGKMFEGVPQRIEEAMRQSSNKIPLDLHIDEGRLIAQVQNAIDNIKKKDYGSIPLKLDIDTSIIRNNVTDAIKGIQPTELTNVASAISSIQQSLVGIKDLKLKDTGFTKFASGMKRLSDTADSFHPAFFTSMATSMKDFATDMSGFNMNATGIAAMARGVAKLGESSAKFNAVTFRKFGNEIKKFASDISKAATNTEGATKLISALARLATAGDKMKESTQNLPSLGSEIEGFFNRINSIQFNDNAVKMADALATLSKSANSSRNSVDTLSQSSSGLSTALSIGKGAVDSIKTSFSILIKVLKKLGSVSASVLKAFVNKIKELKEHKPHVDNMNLSFKNLLKTVLGFKGLSGVFNWLKESVSLGAEVTEIDHIVESVFGENMVKYVNDWADNAITKFGIAATSAKKYAGTLTAMFHASNVSSKDAAKMAMDLTELAGDLSAFYNIDTETAYKKIQSGMAGMSRPLQELGISLKAATLEEYRQKLGIEKKYSAMTQAEKVMLRYKYLMENTKAQSGDFARQCTA